MTSRAELAKLRAKVVEDPLRSSLPGPARYRAYRSAYARYRTYYAEHFGLAAAYRGPWRRLRRLVLAEEPTCRTCGEPSTNVDHILPVALGGSPRSRGNLQGLCQRCHSNKTAREYPRLREANWIIDPAFGPIPSDEMNANSLGFGSRWWRERMEQVLAEAPSEALEDAWSKGPDRLPDDDPHRS